MISIPAMVVAADVGHLRVGLTGAVMSLRSHQIKPVKNKNLQRDRCVVRERSCVHGFQVYTTQVDDRGINFVCRHPHFGA
jgi:hypothetical protein